MPLNRSIIWTILLLGLLFSIVLVYGQIGHSKKSNPVDTTTTWDIPVDRMVVTWAKKDGNIEQPTAEELEKVWKEYQKWAV